MKIITYDQWDGNPQNQGKNGVKGFTLLTSKEVFLFQNIMDMK